MHSRKLEEAVSKNHRIASDCLLHPKADLCPFITIILNLFLFYNSMIADTYALVLRIEENTTKIMKQTMGKRSFDERNENKKVLWIKCIDEKKASNNNFEAHHRLGSIEVKLSCTLHTFHITYQRYKRNPTPKEVSLSWWINDELAKCTDNTEHELLSKPSYAFRFTFITCACVCVTNTSCLLLPGYGWFSYIKQWVRQKRNTGNQTHNRKRNA